MRKKPRIIALVSQKGGSGKSTLAIHLSTDWTLRGLRVVILDADPQGSVSKWGEIREQEHKSTVPPIVRAPDPARAMAEAQRRYGEFDIALIDTQGRQDQKLTPLIVKMADHVIIPLSPSSAFDLDAMGRTMDTVRKAKKNTDALFVLNRCRPLRNSYENSKTVKARKHLARYDIPIADTGLVRYDAIEDTIFDGTAITETAADTKPALQFRALVDDLNNHWSLM